MQVQSAPCNYYPSTGSPPYSPVANASLGTDSNNSSPDSLYGEHRSYNHPQHHHHQQRGYQLMDLSSPLSAHHHHHQVHAGRQYHHHHHHQRLQNFQTNLDEQYYAHQEFDSFNGGYVNGGFVNEQRPRYYPQQQLQQQQQQQPINRYNGYTSPTTGCADRPYVQQQQQVYAQPPQLSPHEQFAVNAQLPHQTYSEPTPPSPPIFDFVDATANFVQQPIVATTVIGKQQRVQRAAKKSSGKKRKASDDEDINAQATKMPKLEEPTTCDEGIEDLDDQRLTASMRERLRTQQLNKAYSQLRQTIPCLPSDKLSKIQTVKLATQYIEFLHRVLHFTAMPEAMRQAQASPKAAVLAGVREIVESTRMAPNAVPSHEKLSYAFSVWRMDNEVKVE